MQAPGGHASHITSCRDEIQTSWNSFGFQLLTLIFGGSLAPALNRLVILVSIDRCYIILFSLNCTMYTRDLVLINMFSSSRPSVWFRCSLDLVWAVCVCPTFLDCPSGLKSENKHGLFGTVFCSVNTVKRSSRTEDVYLYGRFFLVVFFPQSIWRW